MHILLIFGQAAGSAIYPCLYLCFQSNRLLFQATKKQYWSLPIYHHVNHFILWCWPVQSNRCFLACKPVQSHSPALSCTEVSCYSCPSSSECQFQGCMQDLCQRWFRCFLYCVKWLWGGFWSGGYQCHEGSRGNLTRCPRCHGPSQSLLFVLALTSPNDLDCHMWLHRWRTLSHPPLPWIQSLGWAQTRGRHLPRPHNTTWAQRGWRWAGRRGCPAHPGLWTQAHYSSPSMIPVALWSWWCYTLSVIKYVFYPFCV